MGGKGDNPPVMPSRGPGGGAFDTLSARGRGLFVNCGVIRIGLEGGALANLFPLAARAAAHTRIQNPKSAIQNRLPLQT